MLSYLVDVLEVGDVFVDAGANTGYFALPIARAVGKHGRVLAFEPAADAARTLRLEAEAAGLLDRITLWELALGSEDASGTLRADPEHPTDWTKRSMFMDGPEVGEVPVRAFDGLIESGDLVPPAGLHAVKIDVEGAEMEVLRGMRRSLERYRPRMLVAETIDRHLRRAGAGVSDVRAFMQELDYVPFDDRSGAEPLELNAVFVPR